VEVEDYGAVFGRYSKYKDDGLIAFTIFHLPFGYEEFIEGIRPIVSSGEKSEAGREIEYEIHDGVFKAFCDSAIHGKASSNAIINAANTALQMGGGVCGAIFKAAGASELQASCDKLAPIQTGEAVITPGFRLPAMYVIHTAGPVYSDGKHGEEGLLRSCYTNSLKRAVENKCDSIEFPLISSGIYGYPKDKALRVATAAIQDFLGEHDLEVYLVVFDNAALAISEKLLGEAESYIDEHYVIEHMFTRLELLDIEHEALEEAEFISYNAPVPIQAPTVGTGIDNLIGNLDETFSETLLRHVTRIIKNINPKLMIFRNWWDIRMLWSLFWRKSAN
jgi:O-acetyl-ADP-ribose deacetylase (regulator of RNase III)